MATRGAATVIVTLAVVTATLLAVGPSLAGAAVEGSGGIGGRVTTSTGEAAPTTTVDLFRAEGDGRGEFLGHTTTDDTGRFRLDTGDGGCFVVVLIAPERHTFALSNYSEHRRCVDPGQQLDDIDVQLALRGQSGRVSGQVRYTRGTGVEAAVIDIYAANGDGSRRRWLTETTTDRSGYYRLSMPPACYVAVIIAPADRTLLSGGRYREVPFCLEPFGSSRVDGIVLLPGEAPPRQPQVRSLGWIDGHLDGAEVGLVDPPLLSGDGQHVVYRERTAAGVRLVVTDLTDGSQRQIDEAPGLRAYAVSDGGERVLYYHNTEAPRRVTPMLWDRDQGSRPLQEPVEGAVSPFSSRFTMSDDGTAAAFADCLWTEADGVEHLDRWPVLSGDGRFLFHRGNSRGRPGVRIDRTTGEQVDLPGPGGALVASDDGRWVLVAPASPGGSGGGDLLVVDAAGRTTIEVQERGIQGIRHSYIAGDGSSIAFHLPTADPERVRVIAHQDLTTGTRSFFEIGGGWLVGLSDDGQRALVVDENLAGDAYELLILDLDL